MPGENPTPTTNCKEDRKPVIPSYIVGVPWYLAYNYNTTADQLLDEGTHSELK
jgi:hypothetical protein